MTTASEPYAFDHDAYVRARLPNFVLAGMGLRPGQRDRPPVPDPTRVRPRPAQTRTRGIKRPTPSPPPSPEVAAGAKPSPLPPPPPLPPDAVTPTNYAQHLARERAVARVARFWLRLPLYVLGALALIAVLSALVNGLGPAPVVVNEDPLDRCAARTLSADQLATERYWEC